MAPWAEMPRTLPVPELLTSGSPMVEGGPSEGAVQVKEGSYPGSGGKSSGEVSDMSINRSESIEWLGFIIVSEGGLRLY